MIDLFAKVGWLTMLAGILLLESLPVIGCVMIGVGITGIIPAIVKERKAE